MNVGDYVNRLLQLESPCDRFEMLAREIDTDPELKAAGISWAGVRARPLSAKEVSALTDEMLSYAREEMGMTPEEIYVDTLKDWHEFLREMHRVAVEMGVEIDISQIDQPITPSEAMAAQGYVLFDEDYQVRLTPKGMAAASEVQEEIRRAEKAERN